MYWLHARGRCNGKRENAALREASKSQADDAFGWIFLSHRKTFITLFAFANIPCTVNNFLNCLSWEVINGTKEVSAWCEFHHKRGDCWYSISLPQWSIYCWEQIESIKEIRYARNGNYPLLLNSASRKSVNLHRKGQKATRTFISRAKKIAYIMDSQNSNKETDTPGSVTTMKEINQTFKGINKLLYNGVDLLMT